VGDPVRARVADAIMTLARRADATAHSPRFLAIATGDHPQGLSRPRYVTDVSPMGDVRALERFVRERTGSPVDGVDAPEALECALEKAAGVAYRPDAQKVLVVLTDVPPHEKQEPPYCPIDWREPAKRLKSQGIAVLPVLVEGTALAPSFQKRTRAFLEGIKGDDEPKVYSLGAKPEDALVVRIEALASRKRLDARAQGLIESVAVVVPK
jgi:hypothetical protein